MSVISPTQNRSFDCSSNRLQRPSGAMLGIALALCAALMALTFNLDDDSGSGERLDQLLSYVKLGLRGLVVAVLTLGIIVEFIRPEGRSVSLTLVPLFMFVGWAVLSITWSPLRTVSISHCVNLFVLCLIASTFAQRCRSRDDLRRVLTWLCGSVLVIATSLLILRVAKPSLGVMDRQMIGLFHATNTAATAALGLLLSSLAVRLFPSRRFVVLLTLGVPVYLVVLYYSANRLAIVTTAALLAILFLTSIPTSRMIQFVGTSCVIGIAYLTVDPGFEILGGGRDDVVKFMERGQGAEELSSLSGREEMWEVMWDSFCGSPWIGHGYFVSSATGSLEVWYEEGNYTAHNLWLQVLVSTGIVGAALLFGGLVTTGTYVFVQGLRDWRTRPTAVLFAAVSLWYMAWGLLNESFMGTLQPESVVFFAILGASVGHVASVSRRRRTERPRDALSPEVAFA